MSAPSRMSTIGLEIGIEFALGQGDLQPSFQFALQQRFLPHLLVVKDNVLHRLLGVPARVVGKIQHAVQIEPFRLVYQIDTNTVTIRYAMSCIRRHSSSSIPISSMRTSRDSQSV